MSGTPLIVPLPITQIQNKQLRDSITAVLNDVPPNAFEVNLNVRNKGLGIMVVKKFGDDWAVVLAGRYTHDPNDREINVTLRHN